jgi:cytochrome c2
MPKVDVINALVLATGLAAMPCAPKAQEGVGDSAAGRAFAARECSPCHAIAPDPHAPRMFEIAPDFQTIANTPGIMATALNASHGAGAGQLI